MGVWRTIQAPSGWIWWGGLTWRALGKSASPLPAPAIVPEVSVLSSFEDRISLLPGPQPHRLCTQTPVSFLQLWATGLSSRPSVPTDRGCSCIADRTPSPQCSSQAASTRWGPWNFHVGQIAIFFLPLKGWPRPCCKTTAELASFPFTLVCPLSAPQFSHRWNRMRLNVGVGRAELVC